jgi:hypothetical protein
MFSIALSDPAWLHATFAIVALSLGFATGVPDGLSLAALFHRGQALLLVNQRLHDSPTQISVTTLGAIASLANFEVSFTFSSIAAHLILRLKTNSCLFER